MLIHQGSKIIESERLTLRAFQYTDDEKLDYYRWAIIEKQSQVCIGQIAISW